MGSQPLILLSNDDGVSAEGIQVLRSALQRLGQVVTVAPATEQSAKSHGITLHRPLRHERFEGEVHSVDGTPVDCVYIALHHEGLLPRRPDVVVSGINHGPNLAVDVVYSGTVAAAREGALRGIPSIAFSQERDGDKQMAAIHAANLVERFLQAEPLPPQVALLNVNIPAHMPQGVRTTRLGQRHYDEGVVCREDPRGRDYFWIGGPGVISHYPIEGSDTEAVDQGFTSITPLSLSGTRSDHFGVAAYVAGADAESIES